MKLVILLSAAAFILGLPLPYLSILYKLLIILAVVIMDLAVASRESTGWRKHAAGYSFLAALILSYLYKFLII